MLFKRGELRNIGIFKRIFKRGKHVKLEIGLRDSFMIIESNLMLTVKMIIIK